MRALLSPSDPEPVEVINANGTSPYVLTCEHAGNDVPIALGDMGLHDRDLQRHISWDIGAEGVARRLADKLDAPLVMQRYSRLVIDCNRPLSTPESIPEVSDGTEIPANLGLDETDRTIRAQEIHAPYHDRISDLLDARASANRQTALISVHSFTPSLEAAPRQRPWDICLLFNRDDALARHTHHVIGQEHNHLRYAFNEPYVVSDIDDYTIPVHGEKRGIPNMLLEIRNDHIADRAGQTGWGDLLALVFDRVRSRL